MATKTYIVLVTTPANDADEIMERAAGNIAEAFGMTGDYAPTTVAAQRINADGDIYTLVSYNMED